MEGEQIVMMLTNRNGAGKVAKWVIALLVLMMGARVLVFVLFAAGLISWGGFSGSSWLWVMPLLMIAMMALMIFVMPRMMHNGPGAANVETPSEILQKRFARGEITKEQYEQLEQTLREHAPAPK